MKNLICRIILYLKIVLILWVPILLIEETFLLDLISIMGSFICSILLFIICLYLYIKTYKRKCIDKNINSFYYNIMNTVVLGIINIVLGYTFIHLIDLNLFHYCKGSGWDCFLYGFEYLIIGFEYALLPVIILIIWLIVKFIKFLKFTNK